MKGMHLSSDWAAANPGRQRQYLAFVGIAAFIWLGVNAGLAAAFEGRFYPGTEVAGVRVGGLTRVEARQRLASGLSDFKLTLITPQGIEQPTAADLGLSYDIDATLASAYSQGRQQFWPLLGAWQALRSQPVAYAYQVDRQQLRGLATRIAAGQGTAAVDATVVVEGGKLQIKPDQDGFAVDATKLTHAIEQTIGRGGGEIAVRPSTIEAEIQTAEAAPALAAAQKLASIPVELTLGGRSFKPSAAEVAAWLQFTKTGEGEQATLTAAVDATKLKNYVQTVANDIYVAPVNKKIHIQNGVVGATQEGKAGLALDQDHALREISQGLAQQQPVKLALATKPVPFKTQYNHTISLDYGRYIEVNLSQQRLWAYQDHQLVYSSAITSGATGAGFGTATGLFSIYYKTTNTRLRGYQYGWDYDVPVKYWMPFHKGYGLHDAVWRSSFGGADYYYGGSHGCVNLPDATAAWIYGWAAVGTPVWVHN